MPMRLHCTMPEILGECFELRLMLYDVANDDSCILCSVLKLEPIDFISQGQSRPSSISCKFVSSCTLRGRGAPCHRHYLCDQAYLP